MVSQLSEIFPKSAVEAATTQDVDLLTGDADYVGHTADGRRLVFEAKYLGERSRLPSAAYLQLASYKSHLEEVAGNVPPVVVLVVDSRVDPQTERTFAKSGIPVISLAESAAETRQRLRDALSRLAITIPELGAAPVDTQRFVGRCFIATPPTDSSESLRQTVIAPTLREAGYEIVGPEQRDADALSPSTLQSIQSADVIVLDMTGQHPNVLFVLGVAYASAKAVILLSQEPVTADLPSTAPVIQFDTSPEGRARLRARLRERLRATEHRTGLG
jgi:hypothetical protein